MNAEKIQEIKQLDELLNLPQQMWLLGAGVSKPAGIPLMHPLTDLIESRLQGDDAKDYREIRALLASDAHVEHVLSHLVDLIAVASRSRDNTASDGKITRTEKELRGLHAEIQNHIPNVIRCGHVPAEGATPARTGTSEDPIVTVDLHVKFVEALFTRRRAGLERRPPVALFTTNYDTLLEDALALCRVRTADGFSGGAMAFWDPDRPTQMFDQPFSSGVDCSANLYKLHGSIDWFQSREDIVVRRRVGARYPALADGHLLLYPQATKYQVAQRDPFARMFTAFRAALSSATPRLLAICGYSFSDDHSNDEIERAMLQRANTLTIVVFLKQRQHAAPSPPEGLPSAIARWLASGSPPWKERVLVAGSRGLYHGSLENLCPVPEGQEHAWWSFEDLIDLLDRGPQVNT